MTESPENRTGRARRKLSTRLFMIMFAVGALLLLLISAVLNWTFGDDSGIGGSGQPGSAPQQISEASAGTCLSWTAADAVDAHRVDCREPHVFEVTGRTDLSAEFAGGAPFPDTNQWQGLKRGRCGTVSAQHLHGRFDPKGRFAVGAFTPSEQGWNAGDRTLHCGLQQAGPSGRLSTTTGSAGAVDQSNVSPPGRCLGINGTSVWDRTECAQPHSVEITGIVDLAQQFPNAFPPENAQDEFLSSKCTEITGFYAGSPNAAHEKGLTVYWDTLSPPSWDAGSRRVNCKVSAQLPDRSGLAPITGGVTGAVQVSPTPAPTRPDGGEREIPATGDR